jgi:hypothetical protein
VDSDSCLVLFFLGTAFGLWLGDTYLPTCLHHSETWASVPGKVLRAVLGISLGVLFCCFVFFPLLVSFELWVIFWTSTVDG